MTKIKICGLSRPIDIDWINEAKPDYCGFIIHVPKSRRNIGIQTLKSLRSRLDESITPVGVFRDEPIETIVPLVRQGILELIQLHGSENDDYIRTLKKEISVPIIRAFTAGSRDALIRAEQSPADFILLDNGAGGTGRAFDWTLLKHISRPYFLAGGLGPDNLPDAIRTLSPWGVDMSSGVETEGVKDRKKILAAVAVARSTKI